MTYQRDYVRFPEVNFYSSESMETALKKKASI